MLMQFLLEILWCKYMNDASHFDGLMQERRNSIANALELSLSCSNPSISG